MPDDSIVKSLFSEFYVIVKSEANNPPFPFIKEVSPKKRACCLSILKNTYTVIVCTQSERMNLWKLLLLLEVQEGLDSL